MENGKLYLVSTPIGNLKDITYRAVEILNDVDIVACEDTRKTGILLNHYNIKANLISYHDHNKVGKGNFIINELKSGKNIALVSDAGTPGINDPGYNLVRDARKENIEVFGIPGACAAINALVISSLPTDRFCYEGFLPPKKGRKKAIDRLKDEERTIIIYESVHKILKTLEDLGTLFPTRLVSVHREMTKIYEEFFYGSFLEVIEMIKESVVKGEYVIIVSGIVHKKKEKVNKYKPEES